MAQRCPNCGLYCPPDDLSCDCGYQFKTGYVSRSRRGARPIVEVGVVIVATWFASRLVCMLLALTFEYLQWGEPPPVLRPLVWFILLLGAAARYMYREFVWKDRRQFFATLVHVATARGLLRERVPTVPLRLGPPEEPTDGSTRRWGRNRAEVMVRFDDETLYVCNAPPQSFAFVVPGRWRWGGELGLLQSVDGDGIVGALLVSPLELRFIPGATTCARAAARLSFRDGGFDDEEPRVDVQMLDAERFRGMVWQAVLETETRQPNEEPGESGPTAVHAKKFLFDIGAGWVAQVTCHVPTGEEGVLRRLADTIGSTDEGRAYWPLLAERHAQPIVPHTP